jgi:hypothetical protein
MMQDVGRQDVRAQDDDVTSDIGSDVSDDVGRTQDGRQTEV